MPAENLQSLNWDAVELETVNPHMQRRIVTGERMTVARTATCTNRSRK